MQRNMPPGKRSSAVTQSRMAAMSRCQTAWVMKRLRAAMVLNFGDKVLFADQTAGFSQKENETKLRSEDIAYVVKVMLEMDDRGFTTELTVFATNPVD